MALTPEQQAELDRLQAEAAKPEPRTETGVTGILHALIDTVSGVVAHRGEEAWAKLHSQAEALAPQAELLEPEPGAGNAPAPPPAYGTESTGLAG